MTLQQVLAPIIAVVAVAFFLRSPASRRRGPPARVSAPPSARALAEAVAALEASGALWPEIFATLNPGDDARLRALLIDMRGPHMFVPALGLRVIAEGCTVALRRSARASAIDAMEAALRSADAVVDYGR